MNSSAEALRKWKIPPFARFEDTSGGLVRLCISTLKATATIYLHGAHVTDFQPSGEEPILFLSEKTALKPGKAIRGGVPVIFPWFGGRAGHPESPAHGFARTLPWAVESVSESAQGEVEIELTLTGNEFTRSLWPHDFLLRHRITVGTQLSMTLEVENRGAETFEFEAALHTYLKVEDVREASVTGLGQTDYLDKVDQFRRRREGDTPIRISGETDRVYVDTRSACIVNDPAGARRIEISKEGSATTVLWNPWIAKATAMSDFGDEEWPQMLCIETANVGENRISLPNGARHQMSATIRALPRAI